MSIEQSAAILLLGVLIGCAAMHYLHKSREEVKAAARRAAEIDAERFRLRYEIPRARKAHKPVKHMTSRLTDLTHELLRMEQAQ